MNTDPSHFSPGRAGIGRHRAARRRRLRLTGTIWVLASAVALALFASTNLSDPDSSTTIVTRVVTPDDPVTPAPEPSPSQSQPRPTRHEPPTAAPADVPKAGTGRFEVAPASKTASQADIRYTVEVEGDVPFTPDEVAAVVDLTLEDSRGWAGPRGGSFARVSTSPNTRIVLATPDTVDRLCAPLQTNGEVSCRNGDLVVLNAVRWAVGAPAYGRDLPNYRRYLVNHEVGHRLGRTHQPCQRPGAPSPVMAQQTKGLQGCLKNPWP